MRDNTLRGWACDTNNPSATITVALFTENGTAVGEAVGNQSGEEGIGFLCGGYTNHRFTLPLPSFLFDGQVHTIYAKAKQADGTLVPLTFTPSQTIQVGSPTPQPVVNPTPATSGDLIGYHDEIKGNMTYGWTCDPDDVTQPLRVDFYADGNGFGTFLGSTYASQPREAAVGALCGGNTQHGFIFYLPENLNDGQVHQIYAYGINIGSGAPYKLLGNSPKSYQATPPQSAPTPTSLPSGSSDSHIQFISRDCADGILRFSF